MLGNTLPPMEMSMFAAIEAFQLLVYIKEQRGAATESVLFTQIDKSLRQF